MSNSLAIAGNTHALKDATGQRARPFTAELRTHLYRDSKKRLSAVVGALLSKAEDGDVAAIKEIADRIEGKVITQVSVSTTHTVIDADLLSEAGKLLQIMSGQVPESLPAEVVEVLEVEDNT